MAPGGDVYKEILEPRPVFSNYDMPTASIDSTSSSLKRGAASSGGKPGSSTYDVHDLLECPVCMNLMCPPINQCPNGHTLCSHCKHRVHSCPTCRYELGNIRCLALERVAESLELPCRYQDMGCHDLFPYYTKLKHESNCRFRPFSCPYAGSECSITGDIPFLVMHLKEDHRVDMHNGCTFNHRYVKSNPHEVENATWMLTIFNCFGRQFCLHFEAFSLGMAPVYMAFLRFMGDDHDAKKFRYSLDVGRSGRKLGWQGIPRSIRESHRQVRDSLDGLIIHRDLALFFSGGDGQELKLKALAEDSRPGEKEYYERQFATLKSFEQVDRRLQLDSPEEDDDEEQAEHERAMKISNYANIVLLAFKIYATVRTGSLAIAASTLDSLLDLLAGAILWLTHLSMKNVNIYKYPIGKLRVQPVGIIVFAAIMATLGFQVLVEGVEQLIKAEPTEKMSSSQFIWLCVIMITATVVKFVLYLYCRSSGNDIVRAYAKDHYFDVVTNVVGLIAAIFGDKFYWWIDPAGAIILAIYTIINWSGTVMENAVSLVGQTAPPEVLQKLTYLVIRHPQVKRIDTIRAYTFGVLYFVEVDIELPEEIPLKEAHAIGEALQDKLEKLPEVERAFVHLDYECDHKPEHTVLSRLPNIDA